MRLKGPYPCMCMPLSCHQAPGDKTVRLSAALPASSSGCLVGHLVCWPVGWQNWSDMFSARLAGTPSPRSAAALRRAAGTTRRGASQGGVPLIPLRRRVPRGGVHSKVRRRADELSAGLCHTDLHGPNGRMSASFGIVAVAIVGLACSRISQGFQPSAVGAIFMSPSRVVLPLPCTKLRKTVRT